MPEDFAAITCFFSYSKNPYAVERYKEFEDHLKKQGVKLYTIELAFFDEEYVLPGWHPTEAGFRTSKAQGTYLRLRTDTVLWHKESLLNILAKSLPPHIKKIAWLDCDILIKEKDWAKKCTELLDTYPLVQIGSTFLFEEKNGEVKSQETMGKACQTQDLLPQSHVSLTYHVGLGWAVNRDFFNEVGLFDYDITGSGDTILFYSAGEFWDSSTSRWLRKRYDESIPSILDSVKDYRKKCSKYFSGRSLSETVGYVDTEVLHKYHGNYKRRGYVSRLKLLDDIDIKSDLVRNKQGLLEWVDTKNNKPFEKFFLMKDEDTEDPCEYENIKELV